MIQTEKLEDYCNTMLLSYDIDGDCLVLEGVSYTIITDIDRKLFDEDLEFIPDDFNDSEDGYVFEFGGRWYIQEKGGEVTFTELKYKGKAKQKSPTKSFLGIRSSYELMNGLGLYKDWVSKAKFLGITTLGICEKATLSGVLVFQNECKKNDIKSIIGMTVPIKGGQKYDIKLYVKNFQGWLNLLKINSVLNVNAEASISEEFLINNKDGLFIIADPKSMDFSDSSIFEHIDFYQLDTVNFLNEDKDQWYIDNLEKFIKSDLQPINIIDAFYLEKEDFQTREIIWTIAKSFDDKTDNQFFKNTDQHLFEFLSFYDSLNSGWLKIYNDATHNLQILVDNCCFEYDTNTRHLPKYVMTDKEAKDFNTNDELFLSLIKKGINKRGLSKKKYIERVKTEIKILKQGDVIDYFLVLHDIIRDSKEKGFITGIGRGSAGGSLVAYLLGIIEIDPLEFDLLFERFLNSGRLGEYVDKPSFTLSLDNGDKVELMEGSLVKVEREGSEIILHAHDVREGDNLLKY